MTASIDILAPRKWEDPHSPGTATPLLPRLYNVPPFPAGAAPSSWIHHIASLYASSPGMILQLFNWHDMLSGLDFEYCFRHLARAAGIMMIDPAILHRRLLAGAHLLGTRRYNYRHFTEHTDHTPVYRYCAQCLAEDAVPYFRLRWRLAPVVLCARHHVVLSDRCPVCHLRINLSRRRHYLVIPTNRWCVLRHCPRCAEPLNADKPQRPPRALGLALRSFEQLFFERLEHARCHLHDGINREWEAFIHAFFFKAQLRRKPDRLRLTGLRIDWKAVLGPMHFDLFVEWLNGRLDLTFAKADKK